MTGDETQLKHTVRSLLSKAVKPMNEINPNAVRTKRCLEYLSLNVIEKH